MQAPPIPAASRVHPPEAAPGGPQQHIHITPSSAWRQPRLTSQSTGRVGGRSKAAAAASSSGRRDGSEPPIRCATQVATWVGKPTLCSRRARARARARLTYGPPCSFPPLVRAHGAPGELGTHPEAAPGEAPNLAPSARNGRLPWELWREKVRRIRDYMLFTMHARAAHAGPTAAGLAMARYAGLSSSAAEPWGRVASTRVWPCRLSLRGRL